MQTPAPARPYVMTRRRALWLGALAVLPGLLLALFFVGMLTMVFTSAAFQPGAHAHREPLPTVFLLMFPLHCVLMVTWATGLVLFIIDVFRNPHVAENLRPLWMVLFFFVGMLAVPAYWFLYVWQPQRRAGTRAQVQP